MQSNNSEIFLTKNQKKKRRQKLSKSFKKISAAEQQFETNNLNCDLPAAATPEDERPRKRLRPSTASYPAAQQIATNQATTQLFSVPTIVSAEPHQRPATQSCTTVGQTTTADIPIAPIHLPLPLPWDFPPTLTEAPSNGYIQQYQGYYIVPAAAFDRLQALPWLIEQQQIVEQDMRQSQANNNQADNAALASKGTRNVCRKDLSQQALLIDSHFTALQSHKGEEQQQQEEEQGVPLHTITSNAAAAAAAALGAGALSVHITGVSPVGCTPLFVPGPTLSGGSFAGQTCSFTDQQQYEQTQYTAVLGAAAAAAAAAAADQTTNTSQQQQRQQGNIVISRPKQNGHNSKVYTHGNYHRYYGYRPIDEDPRLSLFDRRWFAGKRCMDVGCNEGLITLEIAARFGPASMVGMDIDEQLIRKACTNLRQERGKAETRAAAARRPGVDSSERKAARTALSALTHTWFIHGDFSAGECDREESLDMISALSVTKWVHLHGGDAGVKAMFKKVHALLASGGLFLVEPQPWKSYKNASAKLRKEHAVPDGTFFHRLEELELRPEQFVDYLCDEVGFRLVKRMHVGAARAGGAQGFDRPMYLFRKV